MESTAEGAAERDIDAAAAAPEAPETHEFDLATATSEKLSPADDCSDAATDTAAAPLPPPLPSPPPAPPPPYVHRPGARLYLESSGLAPLLRLALAATLRDAERARLRLAAGGGLDDGGFRPRGWRPFNAPRALAEHLLRLSGSGGGGGNEKDEAAAAEEGGGNLDVDGEAGINLD